MSWVYHMFHPFTTKFYILSIFWWLSKKIFACATHYWTPLLALKINERPLHHYPFLSHKFAGMDAWDEFNQAIKDKISIQAETISSSYNASVQINWVAFMLQEYVPVASSSSNESKEEEDAFFNQQPPENNRAFMHLIWEGIKRTYKLIKGQKKKKTEESRFRRTHSEGGSSSMGKRGKRA